MYFFIEQSNNLRTIENQIRQFGDNEYTKEQFDDYKEEAESLIREHLEKEYYFSPGQIGHDYSVWFLANEMSAFEHIEASSNWTFQQSNEARFRIVHLNNYDEAFAECDYDLVVFDGERPDNWDEFNHNEKVEWFKENYPQAIEECEAINRDEAIESIIDAIEWDEIEDWFNAQFETEVA